MNQIINYEQALILYKSNRFKECISLIGDDSNIENLQILKAACHAILGDNILAENILKNLIKENPKNLDAYNNLSIIYIKSNYKEQAYFMLQHILINDPNHIDAISNMAILCKDLNKYEESIKYFKILKKMKLLTYIKANDYCSLLLRSGFHKESSVIKSEFKLTYNFKINIK